MTTPTVIETRRAGQTNERVELARYTISAGEHVIYAQRVLRVVRLVDEPTLSDGRRYIIESELTVMAELEAIVADYLQQAASWDVIPAAGPCPPPGRDQDARVAALLHHGGEPSHPDRDRAAFTCHLIVLGCQPASPQAAG